MLTKEKLLKEWEKVIADQPTLQGVRLFYGDLDKELTICGYSLAKEKDENFIEITTEFPNLQFDEYAVHKTAEKLQENRSVGVFCVCCYAKPNTIRIIAWVDETTMNAFKLIRDNNKLVFELLTGGKNAKLGNK